MNPTIMANHSVLIFIFMYISTYVHGEENIPCVTPSGAPGQCVPLKMCSNIFTLTVLSKNISTKTANYMKSAECNLQRATVEKGICCQPERIFELPERCGLAVHGKLAHGNATKVFEFPWMALLMYRDFSTDELVGNCGGTLISDRYVLTAAHCLFAGRLLKLEYVRLGEHTISKEIDCNNYTDSSGVTELDCAEPVENILIDSYIIHPQYRRTFDGDDVGLIRLDRKVIFKDHIQPICLPISSHLKDVLLPEYLVAGWGLTENQDKSDVLLKAKLPRVELQDCRNKVDSALKKRQKITISEKQVCAGGVNLVDSCQGDSGGPLMWPTEYRNQTRFIQFGVVSYGIEFCGVIDFPGVYVRIGSYVGWIVANMKA
ncbi:serine protease grass-like [Toxorhynchites rutilus septentrionalis]|uniref:serine protease grass-like n=1 Tax=Toxorhynchites rutilus septentrionalis TaxID=329112 RepID=UPI002478D556|nr:serine protease grass-like [Toxorhynchites rutilus septentrionalis]